MRCHNGVSLFEVLISLFLLSIALLGMDAVHLSTLSRARSALAYSIAVRQTEQAANRIEAARGYGSDIIIAAWNQQNKIVLPDGKGVINPAYPLMRTAVFWGGSSPENCQHNKMEAQGCVIKEMKLD